MVTCLAACVVTTTQHPPRSPREFMPLHRSDDSCFSQKAQHPFEGMILEGDPPRFCLKAAARSNGCRSSGVRHAGNCARAAAHGVQARVRRRALARLLKMAPIFGTIGQAAERGGGAAWQFGLPALPCRSGSLLIGCARLRWSSHFLCVAVVNRVKLGNHLWTNIDD